VKEKMDETKWKQTQEIKWAADELSTWTNKYLETELDTAFR